MSIHDVGTSEESRRGSVRRGRPEAAAAIWDWQSAQRSELSDSAGKLRLRGAIQGVVGFSVGALFWFFGVQTLAVVALSIAGIVFLSALLSPTGIYRAIDRFFHALGEWIGRGLTWLLLPAMFYLVFFPFGALFRRGRRDTMKRLFESERKSYWSSHRGKPEPASYERQF